MKEFKVDILKTGQDGATCDLDSNVRSWRETLGKVVHLRRTHVIQLVLQFIWLQNYIYISCDVLYSYNWKPIQCSEKLWTGSERYSVQWE